MSAGIGAVVFETLPTGSSGPSVSKNITIAAGSSIYIGGTGTTGGGATLSCDVDIGGTPVTVTPIGSPTVDGTNGQQNAQWFVDDPGAGTYTLTVSVDAGTFYYVGVLGAELTGCDTSAGPVANSENTQNGPGGSTDAITSGSDTPSSFNALVIAFCINNAGAFHAATEGTGFTSLGTGWGWELSDVYCRLEYKVATSGAQAGTFTAASGGGGSQYSSLMAAFKEAGTPPATETSALFFGVGLNT